MRSKIVLITIMLALGCVVMFSCGTQEAESNSESPVLAEELILYNWEGDIPQSVLDAFTEEYGVKVTYVAYEQQEDAIANIIAGELYDVVILDNDFLPWVIEDGLVAEIDYHNVPNFKNISANFRDMAYDPRNEHSIPYSWGTSALVVRSDLLPEPITSWTQLWELGDVGKIALRDEPRDQLGVALKSLGISVNTEDPDEVKAALDRMLEIKDNVVIVDSYAEGAIPTLLSGEAVVLIGWAEDAVFGREENEDITYVLPEEGPMLWGDNFCIPANSPHKYTAEVFLNFILRPEIAAEIANDNYYATANEAAWPLIDPELRNDPAVFPPNESLAKAEVYMPQSDECDALYQDSWAEFVAAIQ